MKPHPRISRAALPVLALLVSAVVAWLLVDLAISGSPAGAAAALGQVGEARPERPRAADDPVPIPVPGQASNWPGTSLPLGHFAIPRERDEIIARTDREIQFMLATRDRRTSWGSAPTPLSRKLGALAELDSSDIEALDEILRRHITEQIEWERGVMAAERTGDLVYRIVWREVEPSRLIALRDDLIERFGEPTARLFWIRGGLDSLFEAPRSRLEGGPPVDVVWIRIFPEEVTDDNPGLRLSLLHDRTPRGSVNFMTSIVPRVAHLIPSPEMLAEIEALRERKRAEEAETAQPAE